MTSSSQDYKKHQGRLCRNSSPYTTNSYSHVQQRAALVTTRAMPNFYMMMTILATVCFGLALSRCSAFNPSSLHHRMAHAPQRRCHSWVTALRAMDDSEDAKQQKEEDRLLSLLEFIQCREPGREACGLDSNEKEQVLVSQVVGEVEADTEQNLVTKQNGKITFEQLKGDWQLMFTNSRTVIINKSLSGLGRSESEKAKFLSLVQKLGGSKYVP